MKIIQIDVDGVLIDSNGKGIRRLSPKLKDIPFLTYDFNEGLDFSLIEKNSYFNKNFPQGKDFTFDSIMELWRNPCIIDSRDLMPFAIEAMTELSKYFKVVIRTLSFNNEVAKKKEIVLSDILKLPNIEFISVIEGTSNDNTKEKINCDFYLDDYMGNLIKYFNSYTKCFLMDRSYNQFKYNPQFNTYKENITRVYGLKHFYDYMIKLL